jgi:hypothetical protein
MQLALKRSVYSITDEVFYTADFQFFADRNLGGFATGASFNSSYESSDDSLQMFRWGDVAIRVKSTTYDANSDSSTVVYSVRNAGTEVATISTAGVKSLAWNFIRVHAKLDATTGSIAVSINGVDMGITYTNQNTVSSISLATATFIYFSPPAIDNGTTLHCSGTLDNVTFSTGSFPVGRPIAYRARLDPNMPSVVSGGEWGLHSTSVSGIPYVASSFTPTSISGMVGWWDANDTTTLFDATSGGSNVTTDGSPVARWEDKSGNGYHLTQATGGAQPFLKTNVLNGKRAMLFDGSNDWMANSLFTVNLSLRTVFIVWEDLGSVLTGGRYGGIALGVGPGSTGNDYDTLTRVAYYNNFASQITQTQVNSATASPSNGSVLMGGPYIFMDRRNSATQSYVSRNHSTLSSQGGGQYSEGSVTTSTPGILFGGRWVSGAIHTSFMYARVHEVIIYSTTTETDRGRVMSYLMRKWQIGANGANYTNIPQTGANNKTLFGPAGSTCSMPFQTPVGNVPTGIGNIHADLLGFNLYAIKAANRDPITSRKLAVGIDKAGVETQGAIMGATNLPLDDTPTIALAGADIFDSVYLDGSSNPYLYSEIANLKLKLTST